MKKKKVNILMHVYSNSRYIRHNKINFVGITSIEFDIST